jgi:hypothetical protein
VSMRRLSSTAILRRYFQTVLSRTTRST